MYDAIIIGARCAGAPVAMLLARQGYRVLLVDKARFPADIMSGLFIHPRGTALLKRWGVLDDVLATGCPKLHSATFDLGPIELKAGFHPVDGVDFTCAPRRYLLDPILVAAAVEAGAEFRDNTTVQELLTDEDGCITGIRARTAQGTTVTEKARIVIGADGVHSFVARTVKPEAYHVNPMLTCSYYGFFSDVTVPGPKVYIRPYRFAVCIPTNDNLMLVGAQWPIEDFARIRTDVPTHFYELMGQIPELATQVRQEKQVGRFIGTGHAPNFFHKPYGPGWALVGDAGYHKDPILGQGIADSLEDAAMLAKALTRGLSGETIMEEALAEYERERNEICLPQYQLAMQFATLAPPPPDMQRLLSIIAADPEESTRYLGVLERSVPVAEFFAPEHIASLMARAAVSLTA
ncbi:FAD-dependent oxidoreductase [Ktedonobacter sp. SOSP1-85]|uniref:FAD-dependent oxidoreductase n=1 Tax=Ktedonobacter sp. SOSP1-85 TaxID=2778367 RepID=UPI001915D142|nr:NAD(P)/FAD-dependent oxidoreductase [Ktedonobacter sp. SOSP1-85]GHO78754.1 FAD-dependent oxidoreductase [Ktedonobacter sp. SOSP1-85]